MQTPVLRQCWQGGKREELNREPWEEQAKQNFHDWDFKDAVQEFFQEVSATLPFESTELIFSLK